MNILVIGSDGYIGSKLIEYLKQYTDNIVQIDSSSNIDVNDIKHDDVELYNVVIYLAAHSGVTQCLNTPQEALINNVMKFVHFTKKLNKHQKLIYMSSASVYGNTHGITVDETVPLNDPCSMYDFTKQIIDEYMLRTDLNYYGLRLGTVNGYSPKIRNDLIINSMVNDAIKNKHVRILDGHINRAIVDISDLCKLIHVIIDTPESTPGIYNVASFNTTIQNIANVVSELMNVDIVNTDDECRKTMYDFSLDTTKVKTYFNFEFQGTIQTIVKSLVPEVIVKFTRHDCIVCGCTNMNELYDFGLQPLVNNETLPVESLILDYCNNCTFIQNRFVTVFGTIPSSTDDHYINWLCQYIDKKCGNDNRYILDTSTPNIVEKLCTDYEWSKVQSTCDIDKPFIIIDLNTLGYIPDVHVYVKNMHTLLLKHNCNSKLILQIPYTNILNYDTIYHGHLNYFNQKSLITLFNMHNLRVTDIVKTTEHDQSYLVTVTVEGGDKPVSTLFTELDTRLELPKLFKYFKLNLQEYISSCREDGYKIIGYGASFKCFNLLNLTNLKLDYIIDDDSRLWKTVKYGVPIYAPSHIITEVDEKLVIIPFTRKHFESVHQRMIDITLPTTDLTFLKLNQEIEIIRRDIHSSAKNIKTTVIMHFYNEEYLLPYWLNHHKYIFDHGILINYNSTDTSLAIIQKIVPNWTVINTDNQSFDLRLCDIEVMKIEQSIIGWKIALNITEFLCCDNLHHLVEKYQDKYNAISIKCVPMVQSIQHESEPLNIYSPLIKQRTYGTKETFRKTRTIHCAPDGQYDGVGRHYPKIFPCKEPTLYEAVILWYGFSPFNDAIIKRKLQIQTRMTDKDKQMGIGKDHIIDKNTLQTIFQNYQPNIINFKDDAELSHHFKTTYLMW